MNVLASRPSYDLAQHEVTYIGVDELPAGLRVKFQSEDSLPSLIRAVLVIFQRIIGYQSALMRQQLEDRDVLFAVLPKFRDVLVSVATMDSKTAHHGSVFPPRR